MGHLLGLGISHYPGFLYPDDTMSVRIRGILADEGTDPRFKDPRSWPVQMRQEWGDDEGLEHAARHRARFLDGARRARDALLEFAPDAVVIFGDDQFENFREDLIPCFAVYLQEEFRTQPFLKGRPGVSAGNVFGLPEDHTFVHRGAPTVSHLLAASLIEDGFDVAFGYQGHHDPGLPHAFINTLIYLDYWMEGLDVPVVPFHVNAYGSSIIRRRGGHSLPAGDGGAAPVAPPAPPPWRAFDLGRSLARTIKESDLRVALVGSSSWSHAFLTEGNGHVYPDVDADRARFAELTGGDLERWRSLPRQDLEAAGQHELLNWMPLAGAMCEVGAELDWADLAESYVMNSSKCCAVFRPS